MNMNSVNLRSRDRGLLSAFKLTAIAAALLAPNSEVTPQRSNDRAVTANAGPDAPWIERTKGEWRLRFRLPMPERSSRSDVDRIPVAITPGRWLSGSIDSSGTVAVRLSESDLALITPVRHHVSVLMPGWREERLICDSSPLFQSDPDIRSIAESRIRQIWPETGMGATVSAAPGLAFVPAALDVQRASRSIEFGASAREIYLLFAEDGSVLRPRIQVDISPVEGDYRSFTLSSSDLITVDKANGAAPPRYYLAEIDLGSTIAIRSLSIRSASAQGQVRLAAVSALGDADLSRIKWITPRVQRLASAGPATLFAFPRPELSGWEVRGGGWGTTDTMGEPFARKGTSRYFADSKANGGEPATGTILSPPFEVTHRKLEFLANGHSAKNFYGLVDAKSGAELRRSPAPEKTGPFEKIAWDLGDLRGRLVRFKAVDEDDRTGFAWLAFDAIRLVP